MYTLQSKLNSLFLTVRNYLEEKHNEMIIEEMIPYVLKCSGEKNDRIQFVRTFFIIFVMTFDRGIRSLQYNVCILYSQKVYTNLFVG